MPTVITMKDQPKPSPVESFVVAVGNPFDGVTLYGPFKDAYAAEHFSVRQRHCWIIKITPPEDLP